MFRILNPTEEPQGQILSSDYQSQFRKEVFQYRKLSADIYFFASATGLQLKNAVRVAENVPAYIDLLNNFFMSGEPHYDLMHMLIDDPVSVVSAQDLYTFACNYITHVNETGLFYDWGKEHYIWELIWEAVRESEFPQMPSRVNSVFLFDNIKNAQNFYSQYRDQQQYKLVEVHLAADSFHSFDMNWFTDVPADITIAEIKEYARNYWSKKHTDNPVIEVLYQGQYSW